MSATVEQICINDFLQSLLICFPKKVNQHGGVAHLVVLKCWTLKEIMKMNTCSVVKFL